MVMGVHQKKKTPPFPTQMMLPPTSQLLAKPTIPWRRSTTADSIGVVQPIGAPPLWQHIALMRH